MALLGLLMAHQTPFNNEQVSPSTILLQQQASFKIPLYLQVKLDFCILFRELVHAEAQSCYYLHKQQKIK